MINLASSVLHSRSIRALAAALEEKLPPLKAWHRFEYEQHFAEATEKARMFSGVYESFEAALRAVPANFKIGHDHAEVADRHASEAGHIWPSDYPVLLWLVSLLKENLFLFDLGGSTGISYYGFRKYLRYPKGMVWVVCEVPAVAKLGAEIAKSKSSDGLSFTTSFEDANGADVLLASSSLQFIETPLPVLLLGLRSKPRHVLINRTPLSDGPAFVTLHNLGPAICPYRVENKDEFIERFQKAGYSLVDTWESPEFSCYIPFHPAKAIRAYTGMYYRLDA